MDNYEKKYKESLKIAIIAHKDEDRHLKATLERIFPELKESKSFINTLETKEEDLDYIKKELDELINHDRDFGWGTLYDVATHFFKLGLKVHKGE